jgi:hypothetical protein
MAMFVNGLGQNEHFFRGPSIDASYQVSVHLTMLFQRRIFLEIDQSETRIACGARLNIDTFCIYSKCSYL